EAQATRRPGDAPRPASHAPVWSPDLEVRDVQRRRRDAGEVDRAVDAERKQAAAVAVAGQRRERLRSARKAGDAVDEIDDPGRIRPEAGDRKRADVRPDLEQGGRAAVGERVVEPGVNDVARPLDREPRV